MSLPPLGVQLTRPAAAASATGSGLRSKALPLLLLVAAVGLIASDLEHGEVNGSLWTGLRPAQDDGAPVGGGVDAGASLAAVDGEGASSYRVGADGAPVEVAAGQRRYGDPFSPAVLAQHRVRQYPECPRVDPSRHLLAGERDSEFAAGQLRDAPALTAPFRTSVYFCALLPTPLYDDLLRLQPPVELFENAQERAEACTPTDCRYTLSVFRLLRLHPDAVADAWPLAAEGLTAWRRLLEVLFSAEFERALWEKLALPPRVRVTRRELRLVVDKHGYASGRVHTDTDAKKVATLQLYLPRDAVAVWDYGTCLHSRAQFDARTPLPGNGTHGRRVDGEAECAVKFRFLPNSGYAFSVSGASYHSAPNSRTQHFSDRDRVSVIANWY